MSIINYVWRLLGTASSFAFFGIGGLILGAIVFPIAKLFIRDAGERKVFARRVVGKSMALFIWYMQTMGVLSYEFLGLEHVEPGKQYLIIANHPSLIDVVFILSRFPDADCIIREGLLNSFFIRNLLLSADYLPNTHGPAFIEQAVGRLAAGSSLILFPEGTRSLPGQPLRFFPGAAAIAVRAGASILPVVITCRPTTLTKAEKWYEIPAVKPHFSLIVQYPWQARRAQKPAAKLRDEAKYLNDELLEYFTRRLHLAVR